MASLEVVGIVPFVLFVAFLVWQLAVGGYAAVYANEAARNAARAASLKQDAVAAGLATLPAGLTGTVSGGKSGDGYRYTVTVQVPRFTKVILGPVSRTVTMPGIE
ncbi:MAG: hypothetical protein IPM00_16350 [Tetrasphaera sp.]|nr:hypothetical protein [Tetrasphaera sp.]